MSFIVKVHLCWSVLVFLIGVGPLLARDHELSAAQPVVEVFKWRRQRCNDFFLPDSPARAVRARGGITLIAAHFHNGAMRGDDFSRLAPDCSSSSGGDESSEPSDFNDRFWIQALYLIDSSTVMALGSHDYTGMRHPGKCQVPQEGYYQTCWYSSIVIAAGSLAPLYVELTAGKQRIFAASPHRYDGRRKERSGFLTVSNIVRHEGYAYVFAYSELPEQRGNCLFRVPQDQPFGPWLAMTRGGFTQMFSSPYEDEVPVSRRCDVIASDAFPGPIRSVVWLSRARKWVAVSMRTAKAGPTQADHSGVFYSFSEDLVHWSPPKRLFAGLQPWGQKTCTEFYEYPSLIDHGSKSDIFDTVDTDELYLYLTRFNYANCKKGLDRDLVRFRVRLPHY